MTRREFSKILSAAAIPLLSLNARNLFSQSNDELALYSTETKDIFDYIIKYAFDNSWNTLGIGDIMGKVGSEFIGTTYLGGTLEGNGVEICRINLAAMDCFTFCEACLCIARTIKNGKRDIHDFARDVIFTRYRDGVLAGYTSRLHYTSDWIYDNVKKNTVKEVTKSLGGRELNVKVSFMSANPGKYLSLKNDKTAVQTMSRIEREINQRNHYYIPSDKIKSTEKKLFTGDLAAIATSAKGLDYSHIGMINFDRIKLTCQML